MTKEEGRRPKRNPKRKTENHGGTHRKDTSRPTVPSRTDGRGISQEIAEIAEFKRSRRERAKRAKVRIANRRSGTAGVSHEFHEFARTHMILSFSEIRVNSCNSCLSHFVIRVHQCSSVVKSLWLRLRGAVSISGFIRVPLRHSDFFRASPFVIRF